TRPPRSSCNPDSASSRLRGPTVERKNACAIYHFRKRSGTASASACGRLQSISSADGDLLSPDDGASNMAELAHLVRSRTRLVLAVTLVFGTGALLLGEQVAVRHTEGLVHGFLALRTLEGDLLADGDLLQNARGTRVTSRLVFRFKDGSLHDETAVFSQRQQFRLVSDHLGQKGPSFPQPIDMTIDAPKGQVTVRYTDDHGQAKEDSAQMDLPSDLANGLILTALKNADPASPPSAVGFVAATPKPRLVKLAI